jgi:hypothetical protein
MKISMFSSATNGRHVGLKPFFNFALHAGLHRSSAFGKKASRHRATPLRRE